MSWEQLFSNVASLLGFSTMSKLEKEIIIKTEMFLALYAFFRTSNETQVQYFSFYYSVEFPSTRAVFRFQFGGDIDPQTTCSSLNGVSGDSRGNWRFVSRSFCNTEYPEYIFLYLYTEKKTLLIFINDLPHLVCVLNRELKKKTPKSSRKGGSETRSPPWNAGD